MVLGLIFQRKEFMECKRRMALRILIVNTIRGNNVCERSKGKRNVNWASGWNSE